MISARSQNAAAMASDEDLVTLLVLSLTLKEEGFDDPVEVWAEALSRGWFEVVVERKKVSVALTEWGRINAGELLRCR